MVDPTLKAGLMAFVSDISDGDSDLLGKVDAITDNPPTTDAEIGFYGAAKGGADERAFRATVSGISIDGTMLLFEDKYIDEMPYLLGEQGWIDADLGKQAERYINDIGEAWITKDEAEVTAFAAKGFPGHVDALEKAIAATPYRILQFDLPIGDTLYLLRVSPDLYKKWANTLFLRTKQDRFGVTSIQWDIYWGFLSYALGLDYRHPSPVPSLDESALVTLKDRGF